MATTVAQRFGLTGVQGEARRVLRLLASEREAAQVERDRARGTKAACLAAARKEMAALEAMTETAQVDHVLDVIEDNARDGFPTDLGGVWSPPQEPGDEDRYRPTYAYAAAGTSEPASPRRAKQIAESYRAYVAAPDYDGGPSVAARWHADRLDWARRRLAECEALPDDCGADRLAAARTSLAAVRAELRSAGVMPGNDVERRLRSLVGLLACRPDSNYSADQVRAGVERLIAELPWLGSRP